MSLLLDALKKAAQEKKAGKSTSEDVAPDSAPQDQPGSSPASEATSSTPSPNPEPQQDLGSHQHPQQLPEPEPEPEHIEFEFTPVEDESEIAEEAESHDFTLEELPDNETLELITPEASEPAEAPLEQENNQTTQPGHNDKPEQTPDELSQPAPALETEPAMTAASPSPAEEAASTPETPSSETPSSQTSFPQTQVPETTSSTAPTLESLPKTTEQRERANQILKANKATHKRMLWRNALLVILALMLVIGAGGWYALEQLQQSPQLRKMPLDRSKARLSNSYTEPQKTASQKDVQPAATPSQSQTSSVVAQENSPPGESSTATQLLTTEKMSSPPSKPLVTDKVMQAEAKPVPKETTSAPTKAPSTAMASTETSTANNPATASATPRPTTSRDSFSLRRRQQGDELHRHLLQAYQSYHAGQLDDANTQYQHILNQAPENTDALQGLAAIAWQRQQWALAHSYYQQLLQYQPDDPSALAAVAQLSATAHSTSLPPIEIETLRQWSQSAPNNAAIQFALANKLAQQQQWREAQSHYFAALSLDKTHPDYAYNLAISLEHLGKRQAAQAMYQKAITLSASRTAHFDVVSTQQRITELSQ